MQVVNEEDIVVERIKQGSLCVFPTETVWGVGGDPLHPNVLNRLAQSKGRYEQKPFALLVDELSSATKVVSLAHENTCSLLVQHFWPGALTIVVPLGKRNDSAVMPSQWDKWICPENKIGLRCPDLPPLRRFISKIGGILVASSANLAGGIAPSKVSDIEQVFLDKVEILWLPSWSDTVVGNQASTVVEVFEDHIKLLREGPISFETLQAVIDCSK